MNINEIIIYLRKSRADDPNMSIEEVLAKHETILQEYAVREFGQAVPEEQIFREVVSGETIDDRPVMSQLINLLETSQTIKGVLVVDPQRLSRGDLSDCGRIINTFRYTCTLVITPSKTYDLLDEYDRKFFEMELMRGNDYLEYTKKILNRGRLASVRQGHYIGSIAPYGYRRITKCSGKDKHPTLEIIPEEADTVKLMFSLYNDGYGFTTIAKRLDSLGIKPRQSKHWSPAAISSMLSNPVYIGKIKWNHRKTVKKMTNGKIIKTRPVNHDDELFEGMHEPIVSELTFDTAKKRRGNTPKIQRSNELQNPFAGLLYCGTAECGCAMSMKKYMNKRTKTSTVSISMTCNKQRICKTKSVKYSDFIARLKEDITSNIHDFEIKAKKDDSSATLLHKAFIQNLENELAKMKHKDTIQKDAYEDGIYTKEEYLIRNAALKERISELQLNLQKAKDEVIPSVDYHEKIDLFTNLLNSLEDDSLSAREKNMFLKSYIQKIEYTNESESLPGIGRYIKNDFTITVLYRF